MNLFHRHLLLLFTFLLSSFFSISQSVEGTISNYNNKMIHFALVRGDTQIPIDSVFTDETGYFKLLPNTSWKPGMYRLKTEEGNSFHILINGTEKLQFVSGDLQSDGIVDFIRSEENRNWYAYTLVKNEALYKMELLKPILREYPEDDDFYLQAKQEFNRLQQIPHQKAAEIFAKAPGSLAARFMKADLPIILDLELDFDTQRQKLKVGFLDDIDFTDTDLIFSNILNSKLIDYLGLFQRPDMRVEEIQVEFIKALNNILEKAAISDEVYLFIIEYFIEGFYRMGLTVVSDFLSSLPHLQTDCMEPETLASIEKVIGPYRKLSNGSAAPQIHSKTIEGHEFSLYNLENENTVIVFWSLSCPYCLELVPELNDFAKQNPHTAIVSIVISPNSEVLQDFIREEAPDWIHILEAEHNGTMFTNEYMVYGTPTLFLLDKDKKIVAKPSGMEELKRYFSKL